jgi:hypothetical protein
MFHGKKLSLKDAAARAGVSKVTLWRLVQRGALEAELDDSGSKSRYQIDEETFQKWLETFRPYEVERFSEEPETLGNVSGDPVETTVETEKRFFQRTETVCETVEMVSAELHRLALETARQALESARKGEERAERAERQLTSLSGQLIQYQQVLQERAESLQEKEALAQQAQLLAQENELKLQRYEQEKLQMLEELETTRSRVNWLEKRVPRWVRGLFGAG